MKQQYQSPKTLNTLHKSYSFKIQNQSLSQMASSSPTNELFDMYQADRDFINRKVGNPLGFGYEGRIALSSSDSAYQPNVDAIVDWYNSRSRPVSGDVQIMYLHCHGYYTLEELLQHPVYEEQSEILKHEGEGNHYEDFMRSTELLDRWEKLHAELEGKCRGEHGQRVNSLAMELGAIKTENNNERRELIRRIVKELESKLKEHHDKTNLGGLIGSWYWLQGW